MTSEWLGRVWRNCEDIGDAPPTGRPPKKEATVDKARWGAFGVDGIVMTANKSDPHSAWSEVERLRERIVSLSWEEWHRAMSDGWAMARKPSAEDERRWEAARDMPQGCTDNPAEYRVTLVAEVPEPPTMAMLVERAKRLHGIVREAFAKKIRVSADHRQAQLKYASLVSKVESTLAERREALAASNERWEQYSDAVSRLEAVRVDLQKAMGELLVAWEKHMGLPVMFPDGQYRSDLDFAVVR